MDIASGGLEKDLIGTDIGSSMSLDVGGSLSSLQMEWPQLTIEMKSPFISPGDQFISHPGGVLLGDDSNCVDVARGVDVASGQLDSFQVFGDGEDDSIGADTPNIYSLVSGKPLSSLMLPDLELAQLFIIFEELSMSTTLAGLPRTTEKVPLHPDHIAMGIITSIHIIAINPTANMYLTWSADIHIHYGLR